MTMENAQSFTKITDMTRAISIAVLLIHFYASCYNWFFNHQFTTTFTDRLLNNIMRTGFFDDIFKPKLISLITLGIAMLGINGTKNKEIKIQTATGFLLFGVILYFASVWTDIAVAYMSITALGYILILSGLTMLTRIIKLRFSNDIFDPVESFPQQQMKIGNKYALNFSTTFCYQKRKQQGWVNIINPFRGTLIMGNPGSGKTRFLIEPMIAQLMQKQYGLFVYDFKYPDLSNFAYTQYLQHKHVYKTEPRFYCLNFDDFTRSHRCNPLHPSTLSDISDASEAALTILLGLNQNWIAKQSDFFVKSAINFVKSLIWFLRVSNKGQFCTLPHVVELARQDYGKLFSILRTVPEIDAIITPFVSAYVNDAKEQLEGQVGSARVSLSDLSSPLITWVMTGDDCTLDINDPVAPKIFCMGNNPQKSQTYGAVLSLYVNTMIRQINKKGGQHSALIFDEFPTLYLHGIDRLIATARSNKVAPILCVQDSSQLKNYYGRELAEVIINICGNILSGQVSGESAKQLSDRFGRTFQERESYSINSRDTSVSHSRQLESALPASRISMLSAGEFVGIVADEPQTPIHRKAFAARLYRDRSLDSTYRQLPIIQEVTPQMVKAQACQVRKDIEELLNTEMQRMMDTPELEHLIIRK
jgi:hypothetical protein